MKLSDSVALDEIKNLLNTGCYCLNEDATNRLNFIIALCDYRREYPPTFKDIQYIVMKSTLNQLTRYSK